MTKSKPTRRWNWWAAFEWTIHVVVKCHPQHHQKWHCQSQPLMIWICIVPADQHSPTFEFPVCLKEAHKCGCKWRLDFEFPPSNCSENEKAKLVHDAMTMHAGAQLQHESEVQAKQMLKTLNNTFQTQNTTAIWCFWMLVNSFKCFDSCVMHLALRFLKKSCPVRWTNPVSLIKTFAAKRYSMSATHKIASSSFQIWQSISNEL